MFSDEEIFVSYLEDMVEFQRDYGSVSPDGMGDFRVVNNEIEDKLDLLGAIEDIHDSAD
jgi:hypothetical protein